MKVGPGSSPLSVCPHVRRVPRRDIRSYKHEMRQTPGAQLKQTVRQRSVSFALQDDPTFTDMRGPFPALHHPVNSDAPSPLPPPPPIRPPPCPPPAAGRPRPACHREVKKRGRQVLEVKHLTQRQQAHTDLKLYDHPSTKSHALTSKVN